MTFEQLSVAFVVAVAIHNLEEAVWLPQWSRAAGRWHHAVRAAEFRFAVLVLTVLAAVVAILAKVQGKESFWAYFLCGYALAMLLNVFFPHLLASIALRRYMPGTATALALNLPVTALLLQAGITQEHVRAPTFSWAAPLIMIGLAALIPLLFWIGRRLSRNGRHDPEP